MNRKRLRSMLIGAAIGALLGLGNARPRPYRAAQVTYIQHGNGYVEEVIRIVDPAA